MLAFHHQHTVLIVHGRAQHHHPRRALRQHLFDRQTRVERVVGIDRRQKSRRLLNEGDQRIACHMWQLPSAGAGLNRDLETVRQKILVTAPTAVLAIIMDRMVVTTRRLEDLEVGVCHGPRWNRKCVADGKILKIVRFEKVVVVWVKRITHGAIRNLITCHLTTYNI